jgi:RimJ/RimL family protein N-acetyltransferase
MSYNCLTKEVFEEGDYKIVPIRFEDRMDIMQWRNEQIYHLRQNKPLTLEDQNNYFENVVAKLFEQEKPNQILVSYLYKDTCIGYGGLVHINWIDQHAEISFIIDTRLEKDYFHEHWSTYLKLIEQVAFKSLNFHKIFVYAFDLRPHLYEVLLDNGYFLDARLKDHCKFEDMYLDVVIYSKINGN